MDIFYKTEDLRELCTNKREAVRQLGQKGFKKLRTRKADIEAAARVTDLVAGNPHPLKGDKEGSFSLRLDGGCRLVFEPAHETIPRKEDGGIDWSQVTAIRITYIGDYHE